jgi:hypothetical protein
MRQKLDGYRHEVVGFSARQLQQKCKRTAAQMSFDLGIAEGGARTHDLEVDLFAVIRATRSTN